MNGLQYRFVAVLLAAGLVATSCSGNAEEQPTSSEATPTTAERSTPTTTAVVEVAYLDPDLPITERVDDLLSRMTLAEKIGQMTLVQKNSIARVDLPELGVGGLLSGGGGSPSQNTPAAWAEMVNAFQAEALESRLGIPLIYGVDAVHGHSNVRKAVIFPHNIGLGAANDPELMERIGRITALEMIATGIYWNYAPAVSVPQDLRWGRTFEGYSEDTGLVTELGAAYLRGMQGRDLADPETVLGTPKHYVGDGGTTWGSSTTDTYQIDQGVTEVDENTLRAVHLPPYVKAVEEGALSIMASYSSWGGEKMHAQRFLLTDVLKGELGFEGFIVSDWAGIDQIANDYYEAVVRAINAGIDMNMVPGDYRRFISDLTTAVETGDVPMERIDDAVSRILFVKFNLGLFERPYGDDSLLDLVGSAGHRAVAREAVAKSQVLLKNEGGLLPLAPDLPALFVGGQAADDLGIQMGGWSISWQGGVGDTTEGTTILDGIRGTVSAGTEVVYHRAGRFDLSGFEAPIVCIAAVGELPYAEGLGDDGDLSLFRSDQALVTRMRDQCDRLAVIIVSGRPMFIADLIDGWDAIVAAWLPGTEGQGVADVLFGREPFTGRLSYTWPRGVEQLPLGVEGSEPLFPFGFGLLP